MKRRPLGKTGLSVSELSMGGFFVSTFGNDFETSRGAIRAAVDSGMNLIDTAPNYANSEEVIGKSLAGMELKEPLYIMTKIGGYPKPFNAQSKKDIMTSIERSLKNLNRDYIDIMFFHEPDRPGQYNWWTDNKNYDGPGMEVLKDLQRQGVIKYIGAAGTTVYEMVNVIKSGKFDIVLTANNYNILWHEAREYVVPEAARRGMGIIVGSPLQMGLLAARHDEEINHGAPWMAPLRREQYKRLYRLCDESGIPLPEMALRYLLGDDRISAVLTGARSEKEVLANVATAEKGPLPSDIMKELEAIGDILPYRPFEEPFVLPFGREYYGPGIVNSSFI